MPEPSTLEQAKIDRALISRGRSEHVIYRLAERCLRRYQASRRIGRLIDVGCGSGGFGVFARDLCDSYVGCDLVRYDDFPVADWASFVNANLDTSPLPIATASGDAIVALEVIEHLENPRAFLRDLVRMARPGGLVIVSTPNQLSLLSKLTLLAKNQFNAFQETTTGGYPAHITALLETDLRRIAAEAGLIDISARYSDSGRVPLSARHWPAWIGLGGRRFSDNVAIIGRKML